MENKIKVACFGAGFVGLPTSSVLALKNPDDNVNHLFIL
jgi:UDP-N-acetyl-D-mannosaminuronate dehydrogenase